MGAALLTKPELVRDIMSTLTRNLPIPVTCKIRLLENPYGNLAYHVTHSFVRSFIRCVHVLPLTYREDTLRLIKAAEGAGVSAIAIHARHISDRPRNPARV